MRWPSFRRHARPAAQVFDHGCLAAFIVAVAIIVALIVAAVLLGRAGREERPPAPAAEAAALARCRSGGPGAGDDPACRAAWAEARRAFFQPSEVSP